MPDTLPCTPIGWLDSHPGLKHLFNFLKRDFRMSFSKMDLAISLPSKNKPHRKMLAEPGFCVNTVLT